MKKEALKSNKCYRLMIACCLFLISYSLHSATPVYFKTIPKTSADLFINTTNDIFLLQKGMLERYNSDGTFFRIMAASISTNTRTS